MPPVTSAANTATLVVALADDASLEVTVRVTSGGTAGPGLASRRPIVVETHGVSLDIAPVINLASRRRSA